jgi:hypothetical protein
MREVFELIGSVVAIEERGRPNFWTVVIETPEGPRRCSFNSVRRAEPRDRNSPTEPNPDFASLRAAAESGRTVKVTGYVVRRGEGDAERVFRNGTKVELLGPPRRTNS